MSTDRRGSFSPAGGPVRALRCVAAALACVTASAAGHLGAGGQLSAQAVLAVFCGGAGITWLLSSRQVTAGQIVGLLVLCQAAVHLGSTNMTMDATMLLAHLGATGISALALARGERFAWQLAERLGLRAAPLQQLVCHVPESRVQVAVVQPRVRRAVLLAYAWSLRGPPTRST